MSELIGNLMDIFGVNHKKTKKEASAYMKRYYKAIDDYRKAYSEVIASKLRTPTEIKKLGLYDAEAFDQGVSAMGGAGGNYGTFPGMGEIPILVPTNTTTYVPTLARIEEIEAKILQLQTIINGTPRDRKKFLAEQRIRIKQLTQEKLALQLAMALGEDPHNAQQYRLLTIQELSTRLISARANRPEEKGEPDDIKDQSEQLLLPDALEQQRNESSEALSDVQEKMRQSERSQPDSPYYQAIKKKGNDPIATSAVQWSALTELIRSSITYPQPHMGSLLMFAGTTTSARTRALQTALARIGRIQGAPQQMLDLLSSFDIELRPPYTGMGADASRRYVSQQTQQFRDMDTAKKRQLLLNFNKLFRNLLKKVLADKSLSIDDRKAIKRLHTDLLKGQNTESLKAPENSPEKPIMASDMLMTVNQQLYDTFLRLMAEVGYSDAEINSVNDTLSKQGFDQGGLEYMKLKEANPDIDESEARSEGRATAYFNMIQKLLTFIQSLENKMRQTQGLDEVRLVSIISELYGEAKRSYDEAIKTFAGANSFTNIANTFTLILRTIGDMRSVIRSITTPTTMGGLRIHDEDEIKRDAMGRYIPPPQPAFGGSNRNSSQAIVNEVVNNPNPQLEAKTNEILREIGQPAVSVSVNIRGNQLGLGIPVVVINWSQMPLNMLRMFLRDRLSQDRASPSELLRRRLDIVKNGTFEEVSRLADDLITDKRERLGIIKRFDLTPAFEDWDIPRWVNNTNDPPDPEDPPEPPSGSFIVSINGRHRTFDIRIIISLLIALGVAITSIVKIVEKIRNGKDANARGTIPPTETKDPTNIGTGGDSPNNNIPSDNIPPNIPSNLPDRDMSQSPIFPNRGGNTDPIYGGIGNIAPRSQPFKPIGYPTLDEKLGADYIQADENMLKNSAIMELVQSYNDDATRYNEIIALKYDLEKSEQSLTPDELKELIDLSTGMKNQIAIINQQAPLVASLGYKNSQYYAGADSIQPTKSTDAFITPSGQSISNIYQLIPIDEFTKSIGLNDDIKQYNDMANEYNSIAQKYSKPTKEMPEWMDKYKRANALEQQIQPLLSKINSVLANPETSVGRDAPRTVGYNDLQKSLIDKVANITDWNLISSITEQEKQALRDSPELYKDFESFLTTFNMKTNYGKDALSLDRDNPKWSEFYRVKQKFIDLKNANYKMPNEKAPLAQTDWKLVQQDSQKEYVRSKQDFLDAVARLKNAKASGVSSHQVSQLYNDLETKRLHYETSRQTYEKMADSYKHSLSGRTSFLADMTNERLPNSPNQIEKFDRLQTIERILQNNPDALKEYNDGVAGMGKNISTEQNYTGRMNVLKVLATKYNLVNEYNDASTREIDVKIPNIAEDPNTIVDFQGEGSEEVGESTERANFIDPAEATLFMSDARDRALEQKRWEDFSLVQPWNGLGNPQTNPLLRHQVQEYITRYGKTDKAPKPTPQQMRQLCCYRDQIIKNREFQPNYKTDFPFIPTVQASFGREIWENEFAIPTNNFQSQQAIFTREDGDLPNNQFNTWYPKNGSIYHPDRQIDMNNFDLSSTAKLRTNSSRRPVFEGLPSGLNQQYGSQQVSQFGGETMNNNFGSNPKRIEGQPINQPQRRPNSVFDNLDMSARRTMSMRR